MEAPAAGCGGGGVPAQAAGAEGNDRNDEEAAAAAAERHQREVEETGSEQRHRPQYLPRKMNAAHAEAHAPGRTRRAVSPAFQPSCVLFAYRAAADYHADAARALLRHNTDAARMQH